MHTACWQDSSERLFLVFFLLLQDTPQQKLHSWCDHRCKPLVINALYVLQIENCAESLCLSCNALLGSWADSCVLSSWIGPPCLFFFFICTCEACVRQSNGLTFLDSQHSLCTHSRPPLCHSTLKNLADRKRLAIERCCICANGHHTLDFFFWETGMWNYNIPKGVEIVDEEAQERYILLYMSVVIWLIGAYTMMYTGSTTPLNFNTTQTMFFFSSLFYMWHNLSVRCYVFSEFPWPLFPWPLWAC